MLNKVLAALLATSAVSANAITSAGPHATLTITGLDAYHVKSTEILYSPDWWSTKYEFVIPDGVTIPEILATVQYTSTPPLYLSSFLSFQFQTEGYVEPSFIFSLSTLSLTFDGSPYSVASNKPYYFEAKNGEFAPGELDQGFLIENLYFGAGKGWLPSTDPTCASVSCMTPFATSSRISIAFITLVPEPETTALAVAGLAVAGLLARKRRAGAA